MARLAVHVRDAVAADMPALVGLWGQLRGAGFRLPGRGRNSAPDDQIEARFAAALADPDRRLVVATVDDKQIVGMALFSAPPGNPLYDIQAVEVSAVCVADGHRRRGVGKALLAAATSYAEDGGLDNVLVSVMPSHRDANRFYARLGFAPLVVRRVAPVSVLRRKLATPESRAALLRRDIVPRRGVPRGRRAAAVPVPPIEGPADTP